MKQNKAFSLLGLATKAGQVASGEFSTEKAVKSGEAALVIVSEDASENTTKKFRNMCAFYQVPIYVYATKLLLGHAIGKEQRSSLALLDQGFAKATIEGIEADRNGGNLNGEN